MGLTLENPHDSQKSSSHTEILRTYTGQNSVHILPERGLWALEIFLDSFLSCNRATQKQDYTLKHLTACHWSLQPKGKKTPKTKQKNNPQTTTKKPKTTKQKKKTISLQLQNRLSLGHSAKELPYPYSLEEISSCLSVMASGFTAPGAEEPSCTIIQTLQPNVLWSEGLEMMKSIDFCFPEGTATLLQSLRSLTIKDGFFNSITDYFGLFFVSLMAPSEQCKAGLG